MINYHCCCYYRHRHRPTARHYNISRKKRTYTRAVKKRALDLSFFLYFSFTRASASPDPIMCTTYSVLLLLLLLLLCIPIRFPIRVCTHTRLGNNILLL